MRVLYTGPSLASADRVVNHGAVVDVSDVEGRYWLATGRAEKVDEHEPLTDGPVVIEFRRCWRCSATMTGANTRCIACGWPV